MTETTIAGLEALGRLVQIARADRGQARRVANFSLTWNNAGENGGRYLGIDQDLEDAPCDHLQLKPRKTAAAVETSTPPVAPESAG